MWTPEDESARKIQTAARGYLARKELKKLKKEKEEYEELMDKLEKEVNLTFYIKVGNSLFFKYVDKYGWNVDGSSIYNLRDWHMISRTESIIREIECIFLINQYFLLTLGVRKNCSAATGRSWTSV